MSVSARIEQPASQFAIPGLRVRIRFLVVFIIVILEAITALLDRRFGGTIPIDYLFILPVIVGGLFLGYAGGIGVPIVSILIFHLEQKALANRSYTEADFLQLVMFIVIGTVTARVQADRRRARGYSRRLERLSKAREELTALIAHDLRTPLAGLVNVLRLIAEKDRSLLPETHGQLVDVGIATGEDMAGMISDLLHLHAMESGALELREKETGAAEIVRAAVREVEPLARQRRVEIQANFEEGMPRLWADEVMIRRVVVNLLGNALRFSPDGARVTVRAERSGGEIVFSVADEGPGVPADLKGEIFEKFVGSDEDASKHVSAGLGLAFAKMAVQAHKGHIWVDSPLTPPQGGEPGRGSPFSFALPLTRQP
jgi:signal transduction histidine kinase